MAQYLGEMIQESLCKRLPSLQTVHQSNAVRTPQQMQQMKMMQQQQQQQQNNAQQMPRDQGDVDMNGRPGTPAEGDNGGSPSKRQRLENQQFNGAMMPNGRPMQGVPPQGMMIQNPFNPQMNQAQFRQNGAMGQKVPMQVR